MHYRLIHIHWDIVRFRNKHINKGCFAMVKMTDDSNVASEIRKVHHICHESNRHIMRQ